MQRQSPPQASEKVEQRDPSEPPGWYGVPVLPEHYVSRPRLTALLDHTRSTPLVLLSAPAGTGKTSLVADWVRGSHPDRTSWVTFEAGDRAFWPGVAVCFERLGVSVPARSLPDHAATLDRHVLLSLTAALARLPERVTLVVDGYELVDAEVAADVDFLVRHSGHRLRLVIVARADPVLPLYRYRLEETVTEVRIADLAFTDEESGLLLSKGGVALTPASVRALTTRTGGWAVGLRFAARILASSENPDQTVADITGDNGDIAEYLLAEVLNAQTSEVRELLLSTSVPDTLQPGLAEELGGRSAGRTLELLTKANAFIEPVPEHAGFYRYHPFFRDMLRAELTFEAPDLMDALQRRTAIWFAREGLLEPSVRHFASINAWADASAEIVDGLAVGDLLLASASSPLARTLGDMPEGLMDPAACVVRAVLAYGQGDRARFDEQLDLASTYVKADAVHDPGAVALVMDVLRVLQARDGGDTNATLALVERAERALKARECRVGVEQRHPELSALVLSSKGDAKARDGQLAEAYEAYEAASRAATRPGVERLLLECLGDLAVLACFGGRVTLAQHFANQAVTLADGLGITGGDGPSAAATALAWVSAERNELRAAAEHATVAELSDVTCADPVAETLLTVAKARTQAGRGDVAGALATVEEVSSQRTDHDSWMMDKLRLEKGHLRVANGQPTVALLELEEMSSSGSEGEMALLRAKVALERGDAHGTAELLAPALDIDAPLVSQVEGWLVEASRQLRSGSSGRATSAVHRAVRLASRDGLRRPFRHAADDVRRLLADDHLLQAENPWLLGDSHGVSPRHVAGAALPRQRSTPVDEPMPVVEQLTSKEFEVLGHLAELLTTEEIATTMFVSVNTVRTHVRSILRKLGVSRRNAAVRRARDLELLRVRTHEDLESRDA
jgi:LuxR family maltose regulon positive regulatory protein